jgi:hypothetical protein
MTKAKYLLGGSFLLFFLGTCGNDLDSTRLKIRDHSDYSGIDSISGNVYINDDALYFNLSIRLHDSTDNCFYLHKRAYAIDLKHDNSSLKYVVNKTDESIFIKFDNQKKAKDISISYKIDYYSRENSRNYEKRADQFFLLPEFGCFPRTNQTVESERIFYKIHVDKQKYEYAYKNGNYNGSDYNPPYIILGNFKTSMHDKLKLHIPKTIKTDTLKLSIIIKDICRSYNNYEAIFGKRTRDSLDVFFLARTGGHLLDNGIILDQDIVTKEHQGKLKKTLIPHEVAHLWWGDDMKTCNNVLFEGISEFSAISCIDNKQFADSIFALKNYLCESDNIQPIDFENITPSDENYITYAYGKLPIIFRDLNSINDNRDVIIKSFKQLFEERDKRKLIDFNDLFESIADSAIRKELLRSVSSKYLWPNISIDEVDETHIVFKGENINIARRIPIIIKFDDSSLLLDTIIFTKQNELIEKTFTKKIILAKLDPDFNFNQNCTLDDVWIKDGFNFRESKYSFLYNDALISFGDSIISSFKKNSNLKFLLESLNKKDADKIEREFTKIPNIQVIGATIQIKPLSKYFKILLLFKGSDEKFYGFIDGNYKVVFNRYYIDKIKHIKI